MYALRANCVATDWTSIKSVTALASEQEAKLGAGSLEYAKTVSVLADLHFVSEDFMTAERLYWQALSIRQKALGEAHEDTASTLRSLAELYEIQDRYAEAERFYQWSLSAKKSAMLKKHSDHLDRTQIILHTERTLPSIENMQDAKCEKCERQLLDSSVCMYCTQTDFDAASIIRAAVAAKKANSGPVNVLKQGNGYAFKLDEAEIGIGRHPSNQIVLSQDTHVSRHHAMIIFKGGDFYITDRDTVNGTFVNAKKVSQPTKLDRGDMVTIGGTTLTADFCESED